MDYDEWLFDSIKMYQKLSMYDLQHGVTAADLVEGKSLCVATSIGQKHEICELSLPDKLLHDSKTGKIKKDRDFRVQAGGFSSQPVTEIKHLPGSRCCAVAQRDGSTSVWEMGNESTDLMKEYRPIRDGLGCDYSIKMTVSKDKGDRQLAIGSSTNSIQVIDTETFGTVNCTCGDETKSQQISSLEYITNCQLLCCTVSGDIMGIDTRSKNRKESHHTNCDTSGSYWTMSNCSNQSESLLKMSSRGEVIQLDKRYLNDKVIVSNIEVSSERNIEMQCIQQSSDGQRFSVSGLDGCVYLFDTKPREFPEKVLKPVFTHEGHVINTDSQSDCLMVSKHMWHPGLNGLLISCGNDGSIHAWQWNDDSQIT